jgi:hypothetical protein
MAIYNLSLVYTIHFSVNTLEITHLWGTCNFLVYQVSMSLTFAYQVFALPFLFTD